MALLVLSRIVRMYRVGHINTQHQTFTDTGFEEFTTAYTLLMALEGVTKGLN